MNTATSPYPDPHESNSHPHFPVLQKNFNPSKPTSVHCADLTSCRPAAGITQSVQRLATGWTVQGSTPGECEIFRTGPDRPWGPSSLLYTAYLFSFPVIKRPRRCVAQPSPSSAQVKERVQLYLHSLSGPSGPVIGRSLPFYLYHVACLGAQYVVNAFKGTINLKLPRPG